MDSPESWRWIWLVASALFAIGELSTPGSFFLLPFAVGGAVACVAAFAGAGLVVQWVAFVAVSLASFAALVPLRRRLDRAEPQDGIGARRLMGQAGVVTRALPAGQHEAGLVRIGGELWRAISVNGQPIAEDTPVKVVEVRGTRVIVHPVSIRTKELGQ